MPSRRQAHKQFTDHRFWKYRGCAPHWDTETLPGMSLGDETLSVNAWLAPHNEPQKARLAREKAALAVCRACPLLDACREYALTVVDGGRPAEPNDIWGGMLPGERKEVLKKRRRPAPITADQLPPEAHTPQKRAVLRALAAHTTPEQVAAAAGMDVRTANWQRSKLASLLGLDKKRATRGQLLAVAAQAGLLDSVRVVPCDGTVPAVPPRSDAPHSVLLPVKPLQAKAGARGEQLQLDLDPRHALRLIPQPTPRRLEHAA